MQSLPKWDHLNNCKKRIMCYDPYPVFFAGAIPELDPAIPELDPAIPRFNPEQHIQSELRRWPLLF